MIAYSNKHFLSYSNYYCNKLFKNKRYPKSIHNTSIIGSKLNMFWIFYRRTKLLQMYILWTENVQNRKSSECTMDVHVLFGDMITDNLLIYLFYKQR